MKNSVITASWKDDYYRMTGRPYRFGVRSFVTLLVSHQIRYMKLWRKTAEKKTPFLRLRLLRYARRYGLEISADAEIGKGFYLGHPYSITVAGGGKNWK